MSDRLLELLSQNAGMGDEVAALQAQLLRAKGLRTQAQTDPRRTTGKGGMFSALARGVNAYRAGTMEAENETAQAGIDARSAQMRQAAQEAVGGLPSITPEIDPRTGGYGTIDPAALAQHRALGRALGSGPLPDLAKQGVSISGEAEKAGGEAAKLANLRAMGLVETKDGRLVPVNSVRSNYNAKTGGYEQVGADFTRYGISPEVLEAEIRKALAGGGSWKLSTAVGADGNPIITGVQMVDGGFKATPVVTAPPAGAATPPPPPPAKPSLPGATGAAAPPPPAKPKPGEPGAISQPPFKPQSGPEAKSLKAFKDDLRSLTRVDQSFKPEYAGKGVTGGLKRATAAWLGDDAPKDWQEMEAWWADFDKLIALPERHEFFGSALTPVEQTAWKNAQRVKESRDPKMVKAALQTMRTIASRVLAEEEARQLANYRSPAAVTGGRDAEAEKEAKRAEIRARLGLGSP